MTIDIKRLLIDEKTSLVLCMTDDRRDHDGSNYAINFAVTVSFFAHKALDTSRDRDVMVLAIVI